MASKNNPTNKKETQKVILVLSNDCEKCKTPCERGMKYIERVHKGKAGNGVICPVKK
jgi:hypothetical protein